MDALNTNDDRLIDKYLAGKLTAEEEVLFAQQIAVDNTFAEEVHFRQNVKRMAQEEGHIQIRNMLKDVDAKLDKRQGKRFKWWIASAALLALAALLFLLWPVAEKKATPGELYIAYYEPFPNLIAPIEKGDAAVQDTKKQAAQAYQRGEYTEAIRLFNSLENPDDGAVFYRGLCFLESGQLESAIRDIAKTANSSTAKYQQAAEWYLALLYLKQGKTNDAKVQLDIILQNRNHRYLEKAEEMSVKIH